MRPENAYRNGTLYPVYNAAIFPRIYELADKHGARDTTARGSSFIELNDGSCFGNIQVIYDDGETLRAASDPRHTGESRVLAP